MRSVSHVLTCVIAHHAREYTRRTIRNVVVRPDDITEIMACYKHMYGKPYPNAMKREIADVIQRFDEYQLAKYNGGSGALKLRDVLRITHPTPKTKEIDALLGAMASRLCEDATVCYFHSGPDINSGLKIAHYSKSDSILDICRKTAFYGGGTDMTLPLRWALEEDETVDLKPFDRIIYFSDNQCNHSLKGITRSAHRGKTQNNPAVKGRVFLYIFEFSAYSSVRASAFSLATPQSRSACA